MSVAAFLLLPAVFAVAYAWGHRSQPKPVPTWLRVVLVVFYLPILLWLATMGM